jgi:hypothetical protein
MSICSWDRPGSRKLFDGAGPVLPGSPSTTWREKVQRLGAAIKRETVSERLRVD